MGFVRYLIGIAFLLIAACGSDIPQLAQLSGDAVILAFGDSLTQGTGAKKDESYPAILETLSGRKVINAGVAGEVSTDGLRRLPGVIEKHRPDLLILCHGGNDILRRQDIQKMEANLRAMIQLAHEREIPVVMLGVPQPGLFLSSAEQYQRIADDTGVVFIEDLIPEVLGDATLKSDTVHPNKDGYRVMARNIHAVLQQTGAL